MVVNGCHSSVAESGQLNLEGPGFNSRHHFLSSHAVHKSTGSIGIDCVCDWTQLLS